MLHVFAIEILLKLAVGTMLAFTPLTVIKVLGLPKSESGFWPRLLGITLIGLSAACYMEARIANGKGLALAGAIVINLAAAGMITILLLTGTTGAARRGRLALALSAAILIGLAVVEIAHA